VIWCVLLLLYFQAYHSQFTSPPQVVGNMALLPLRTQFKGPAAKDSQSALLICLLSVVKQFYCIKFFTVFSAAVLVFVNPTHIVLIFREWVWCPVFWSRNSLSLMSQIPNPILQPFGYCCLRTCGLIRDKLQFRLNLYKKNFLPLCWFSVTSLYSFASCRLGLNDSLVLWFYL